MTSPLQAPTVERRVARSSARPPAGHDRKTTCVMSNQSAGAGHLVQGASDWGHRVLSRRRGFRVVREQKSCQAGQWPGRRRRGPRLGDGCSTGEEAYSIAMLLREHLDAPELRRRAIQLFARPTWMLAHRSGTRRSVPRVDPRTSALSESNASSTAKRSLSRMQEIRDLLVLQHKI